MQNVYYEQSLMFAADVNSALETSSGFRHNRGIHQDPFYVLWKTTMPSVLIECGFISNPQDLEVLRSDEGLGKVADSIFKAFCQFKTRYDGTEPIAVPAKETPAAPVAEPAKETPAAPVAEPAKETPAAPVAEPAKEVPAVPASEPVKTTPSAPEATPVATAGQKPAEAAPLDGLRFGVQVLVSSKELSSSDPYFKGYPVRRYKVGNVYKYVLAENSSEQELKKKFAEISKIFPDSFMVRIEGEEIRFWGRR